MEKIYIINETIKYDDLITESKIVKVCSNFKLANDSLVVFLKNARKNSNLNYFINEYNVES